MKESANTEKVTETALTRSLAASVIGILLCMFCLVGTTWAWYSSTAESGENVTVGANFDVTVKIDDGEPGSAGVYQLADGEHTVTLTKTGTAKNGFCQVTATKSGESAGTTYYQDFSDEGSVSFAVTGSGTLKITPMLGKVPTGKELPTESVALSSTAPTPPVPDPDEMRPVPPTPPEDITTQPTGEESPEENISNNTEIQEKVPEAPGDAAA